MTSEIELDKWNPMKEEYDNDRTRLADDDANVDLYVKGIPPTMTDHGLKNLFQPHGTVLRAKCIDPKKPGWPKAGFVCFQSRRDTLKAIKQLNGYVIGKNQLIVQIADTFKGRKGRKQQNPEEILKSTGKFAPVVEADLEKFMDELTPHYKKVKEDETAKAVAKAKEALTLGEDSDFMICVNDPNDMLDNVISVEDEKKNNRRSNTPVLAGCVEAGAEVDVVITGFQRDSKQVFAKVNQRKCCREIGELEIRLHECYTSDGHQYDVKNLKVGDFCMSLTFHQSKPLWRRAVVEHMWSPTVYTVFCLDYGVSEKCTVNRLKAMEDKFLKVPTLAMKCYLHGFTDDNLWDDKLIDLVRSWMKSSRFSTKAKISKVDGIEVVADFINDGKSLTEVMRKFAGIEAPEKNKKESRDDFSYVKVPIPSDCFDVLISHAVSPDAFYCQLFGSSVMDLKYQQSKLGKAFAADKLKALERLTDLAPGCSCVVQSPDDKMWYRGSVLKADKDVFVRLVDYGFVVKVTNDVVYPLPVEFRKLPAQAFKAGLFGCVKTGEKWNPMAVDVMKARVDDISIVEVVEKHPDRILLTLFSDSDVTVNEEMVHRGWATKQSHKPAADTKRSTEVAAPKSPVRSNHSAKAEQDTVGKSFRQPPIADKAVKKPAENSKPVEKDSKVEKLPIETPVKKSTAAEAKALPKVEVIPEIEIPKTSLTVTVCYVEDPSAFWIQSVGENILKLSDQQDKLTEELDVVEKYRLKSFPVGQLCVAKFYEDECWYRATIAAVKGEQVEIKFIDYGNTETVTKGEIFQLPDKFKELPAQAVKACLLDCYPVEDKWKAEAIALLQQQQTLPLLAKVVDRDSKDKSLRIILHIEGDNETSLNSLLVESGFASKTPVKKPEKTEAPKPAPVEENKPKPAEEDEVFEGSASKIDSVKIPDEQFSLLITHVNNPSSIYCQIVSDTLMNLERQQSLLSKMFGDRSSMKSFNESTQYARAGTICAALFSADDQWYRGRVVQVSKSRKAAKVLFIDYGNIDIVSLSDIYLLPQSFFSFPAQAVEISLAGCYPKDGQAWSAKATTFLDDFKDDIFQADAVKTDSNLPLLRVFNHENVSLASLLIKSGLAAEEGSAPEDKSGEESENLNRTFSDYSLTRDVDNAPGKRNLNTSSSKDASQTQSARRPSNSSSLEEKEKASKKSPEAAPADFVAADAKYAESELPLGKAVDFMILNANSSGKFVCQIVDDKLKVLQFLVDEMTKLLSVDETRRSHLLESYNVGTICAAFDLRSSTWQRAIILKEGDDQVIVRYVDQGFVAKVDKSQLCKLQKKFVKLPPMAIFGVLADAKPYESEWNDSFASAVKEHKSKPLRGVIVKTLSANAVQVKLPALLNDLIVNKIALYSIDP